MKRYPERMPIECFHSPLADLDLPDEAFEEARETAARCYRIVYDVIERKHVLEVLVPRKKTLLERLGLSKKERKTLEWAAYQPRFGCHLPPPGWRGVSAKKKATVRKMLRNALLHQYVREHPELHVSPAAPVGVKVAMKREDREATSKDMEERVEGEAQGCTRGNGT